MLGEFAFDRVVLGVLGCGFRVVFGEHIVRGLLVEFVGTQMQLLRDTAECLLRVVGVKFVVVVLIIHCLEVTWEVSQLEIGRTEFICFIISTHFNFNEF